MGISRDGCILLGYQGPVASLAGDVPAGNLENTHKELQSSSRMPVEQVEQWLGMEHSAMVTTRQATPALHAALATVC